MADSLAPADFVKRYAGNPILAPADVPYPCDLIYNAAVIKARGKYWMVPRIDFQPDGQALGLATSDDGYRWTMHPELVFTPNEEEGAHVADSRLQEIDGRYYLTYSADKTGVGIRLGIAETEDFIHYRRIGLSEPDNRNGALFPEKIGGLFVRLDRPFRMTQHEGFDLWISFSPDLEFWGRSKVLIRSRDIPWGHDKIGPACNPIRTDEGWLCIFHGAQVYPERTHAWKKTYRGGVMLLDLDDPTRVRKVQLRPLIEPETDYECAPDFLPNTYRPNVIFPCGAVVEDDGQVKIYYGASDTTVCVATAALDDLVNFCLNG
ncbi:MAG: glycoside hydrolase family 130 protein [Planctomycetes bacterium]|nr:glycoside hydrolase family 130 protein [Planctomycetota bacterium]